MEAYSTRQQLLVDIQHAPSTVLNSIINFLIQQDAYESEEFDLMSVHPDLLVVFYYMIHSELPTPDPDLQKKRWSTYRRRELTPVSMSDSMWLSQGRGDPTPGLISRLQICNQFWFRPLPRQLLH